MANLFDIDREIAGLIDEETGEVLDFEAFEALQMQKDEKIANIALWCVDLDADIKNFEEQIARFKEKTDRAKAKRQRLADYLALFLAGQEYKDGAGRFEVKYTKSKAVVVDDEAALPEAFWKVEEKRSVDKIGIREALKAGDVPGAHIEERSTLKIK